MKILLLGKNGQLGWELQRSLAPLGELIALDRHGDQGLTGDLSDLDGIRHILQTIKPDVVVNAAAYTAVDKAESEPELAKLINAKAPGLLAEEMHKLGGWLVHYSTDYVFNGSGQRPWQEDDITEPLNVYGASKLAGEQAIKASCCRHLIFRTSWVYGSRGNNFAKTMLRLAGERESLNVIADQIGAPTGAELLADVTAHALRQAMARPELGGLYHLAAAGETSWHHYAGLVIEQARQLGWPLKVEHIKPISSQQYPTPARRPLNSRLATNKLEQAFGLSMPPWQQGVNRLLQQITTKG